MKYGNQQLGMIRMYPDECLQALFDNWWDKDEDLDFNRGRLVKAFLPHVDQNPYIIVPTARKEPAAHREAKVEFRPLKIREAIRYPKLPVAALPQYSGERWGAYRVKKRPALIISCGGDEVDKKLRMGKAKWQTNLTLIAAPYYGADEGGKRAGFTTEFVERIKRCEYPQFLWDKLPIGGNTVESILRLDHMQPIGKNLDTVELLPYRLNSKALILIDEWLDWIIKGVLLKNKDKNLIGLKEIRECLMEE